MFIHRKAVGLTIGTHSAKLVEVARRGPFVSIVRSGRVRLSEKPEETREVLQRFIRKGGWDRSPCVIAVSSEALFLRRVETEGGRAELFNALQMEMAAFGDMMPQGTIQGFSEPVRRRGKLSALLAVARPESLQQAMSQAEELGLRVVDALPVPVAFYNAVLYHLNKPRGRFLAVLVGWDGTEVISGTSRDLLYSRRIPIGRAHLPQETGGLASPSKIGLETGTDPVFENWMAELLACLKTVDAMRNMERVDRLLLCGLQPAGPCARLIEERMELPLTYPDAPVPPMSDGESGRMLTATGLALAGVGQSRLQLSLLPARMRECITLRRQRRTWAGVFAAALLILVALSGATLSDRRAIRAERLKRQQDLDHMDATRIEAVRLQQANQEFEQAILLPRKSAESGRVVSRLLDMLSSARHPDDWITLVADAEGYYATGAPSVVPAPAPASIPTAISTPVTNATFQFVIEGYTLTEDLSTVRAMIDSIRKRPRVVSADLLGDDRIREDGIHADRVLDKPLRRFAVEVTLW